MKKPISILLKSFGVILVSFIISCGTSYSASEFLYSEVLETEEEAESIYADFNVASFDIEYSGLDGSKKAQTNQAAPLEFKRNYYSKHTIEFCGSETGFVPAVPRYILNCSLVVYS